jgi:hypothetical protein
MLPAILSQMLGKAILYNGNIESVQQENISHIKEWYEENFSLFSSFFYSK